MPALRERFPVLPIGQASVVVLGDLNVCEGGDHVICDVHGMVGRQLQGVWINAATIELCLHLFVPALARGGDHLLWALVGAESTTVVVTDVDPMAVPAG